MSPSSGKQPHLATILLSLLATACAATKSGELEPEPIAARSTSAGIDVLAGNGLFASVEAKEGAPLLVTDLRMDGGTPLLRPDVRQARGLDLSQDHPYQLGLRLGYGDVDGHDLWSRNDLILVDSTTLDMLTDGTAVLESRLSWRSGEGELLCGERRRLSFTSYGSLRFIDVETRLEATGDGVTFGDTKNGLLSLRLHDSLTPARTENARGFDSEGRSGSELWGQESRWVAHTATLVGAGPDPLAVTVAVFDHPENRLSPCRWHVRPYGIVAANPFGISAFDGTHDQRGAFQLEPYSSLELRYRVVMANRVLTAEEVDALWVEFGSAPEGGEADSDSPTESSPTASTPVGPTPIGTSPEGTK